MDQRVLCGVKQVAYNMAMRSMIMCSKYWDSMGRVSMVFCIELTIAHYYMVFTYHCAVGNQLGRYCELRGEALYNNGSHKWLAVAPLAMALKLLCLILSLVC